MTYSATPGSASLAEILAPHAGQWVAIRGDSVMAAGDKPAEVYAVLKHESDVPDVIIRVSRTVRASPGGAVIHQCPPSGGNRMQCCGRTPFEAPHTDRITTDPALVTCPDAGPADECEGAP